MTGTACTSRTARPPARGSHGALAGGEPVPEVAADLRRVARYAETAAVLDRRARCCASPALAAVLRERAAVRRRTAERIRAGLVLRLGRTPSGGRGVRGMRAERWS